METNTYKSEKICCVFSRKSDRRYKSYISGKYICGLCVVKTKKGYVTIDEYLKNKDRSLEDDFNDMIDSFIQKKPIAEIKQNATPI